MFWWLLFYFMISIKFSILPHISPVIFFSAIILICFLILSASHRWIVRLSSKQASKAYLLEENVSSPEGLLLPQESLEEEWPSLLPRGRPENPGSLARLTQWEVTQAFPEPCFVSKTTKRGLYKVSETLTNGLCAVREEQRCLLETCCVAASFCREKVSV